MILKLLSSVRITVVCLFLLFILTFWGTVAQVQQGLYAAQERFFNSFFFLAGGFFPFPGAQLVLWVLFINLVCATITRFSKYRKWSYAGILIIHFGLLLYFSAAFIIFHVARESNVHLMEGETTNVSKSYHEWELAYWNEADGSKRQVTAFDAKHFTAGFQVPFKNTDFQLTVKQFYPNSVAFTNPNQRSAKIINISGISVLQPKAILKEREKNIAGGVFDLKIKGKSYTLILYGTESRPTPIPIAGKVYYFSLRHARYPLPFTLKLDEFKVEFYPGTQVAKSFESHVSITAVSSARQVNIFMNNPLQYKDYTLFQASYDIDGAGRQYSTLAVVKNFAKILPYVACLVVFFGMALHFLIRAFGSRKKTVGTVINRPNNRAIGNRPYIWIFALMVLVPIPAHAEIKDYSIFKSIPVMDSGRLKPLDTYARNLLIQFSGRDSYERKEAIVWLARVLFTPNATKDDKVLLINHPDIAAALNIPVDAHRRYSFAQIQQVYPKFSTLVKEAKSIPEKERDIVQNEIIRVDGNIQLYAQLSLEFAFAVPHADFKIESKVTRTRLGLSVNQKEFSFIDIALKANEMAKITKSLEDGSADQYGADEAEIVQVGMNLYHWSMNYKQLPLTLIPSGEGRWLSSWDAIAGHLTQEHTRQLITFWRNMSIHYVQGHSIEFNVAAQLYLKAVEQGLSKDELRHIRKFPLERIYHAAAPFLWAKILYIFAFLFFVISFTSAKPLWYRLGLWLVFAGFALHGAGLIARIIIMERPPVSNLYETFIFVSFITVLLGLLIEHVNRQWLGIVVAAISGTALLFIASRYATEGDTLKMLVAVLNSNFWLATHVTTITMGYAATCVAGILGHIWLIQAVVGKNSLILDKTYKTTLGLLGVALTLTFLGTNLGGIWADQSWGRFWGWDPKENGALMIVLWTALLFHAKISKLIEAKGLAIGAVIGMMVVMWAWFGVNLLSIGLHSYGFTSGLATSLMAYAVIEILFIVVTSWFIFKK